MAANVPTYVVNNSTYTDITGVCRQRSRRQLFLTTPPRLELKMDVYEQYATQPWRLDMRRKIEILKYSANSSNSKTNEYTRAERWAQLVNGKLQGRNYSKQVLQDVLFKKDYSCVDENTKPTPTSACDVPGPIVNLYYEPDVPLYNYSVNQESKAVSNPTIVQAPWVTYVQTDVSNGNKALTSPNLTTLYITQSISQNITSFSLNIPLQLSVQGRLVIAEENRLKKHNIYITVNPVYVYVYYNDSLVSTNDLTYFEPTVFSRPTVHYSSLNIPTFQPTNLTADFQGDVYVGNVQVTGMELNTQPGFIYDIRLIASLNVTVITEDGIVVNEAGSPLVLGAVWNTSLKTQTVSNCLVTGSGTVDPNNGFQLFV